MKKLDAVVIDCLANVTVGYAGRQQYKYQNITYCFDLKHYCPFKQEGEIKEGLAKCYATRKNIKD